MVQFNLWNENDVAFIACMSMQGYHNLATQAHGYAQKAVINLQNCDAYMDKSNLFQEKANNCKKKAQKCHEQRQALERQIQQHDLSSVPISCTSTESDREDNMEVALHLEVCDGNIALTCVQA